MLTRTSNTVSLTKKETRLKNKEKTAFQFDGRFFCFWATIPAFRCISLLASGGCRYNLPAGRQVRAVSYLSIAYQLYFTLDFIAFFIHHRHPMYPRLGCDLHFVKGLGGT